jgi:hypothetical protein
MNMPAELDVHIAAIAAGLKAGDFIPYFGPAVLALEPANAALPVEPADLATFLSKRSAVPSRIRRNAPAAAQYIENFKHRKTLRALMLEAYAQPAVPTALHRLIGKLNPPLVVDACYDNAMATVLAEQGGSNWGQLQGVSRAEFREEWVAAYDASGTFCKEAEADAWQTLLYKPLGGVTPAGNFIVSDSDFVEVLTEIDIQTPIPATVKARRSGRHFLYLGCRFRDQLARTYVRQVAKRSSEGGHWAILPHELTRNEARFVKEVGINVLPMSLEDFVAALAKHLS